MCETYRRAVLWNPLTHAVFPEEKWLIKGSLWKSIDSKYKKYGAFRIGVVIGGNMKPSDAMNDVSRREMGDRQ